jgi:hypothetical protein
LRALLYLKIIDGEFAVKRYQRSSSGVVQEAAGNEAVASKVLALTEEEQAAPKGTVLIRVALVQSSLAGACALVLKNRASIKMKSKIFLFIEPGF